jgi:predicted transcriptional regulator
MSRQENPSLGDQELAILTFVSGQAGSTAREVAEHFANEQGLARTTVITVLERLRAKGYLERRKEGAIFRYIPSGQQSEVLNGVVRNFIERTLGGSVSPLVAFLAESKDLTSEEIEKLDAMLQELKKREESQ